MRVGVHSQEFGSVSIATTLSQSSLAAQITTEHSALGHTLAAQMSTLQEKLEHSLRMPARIDLVQGETANSGGSSSHGNGASYSGGNAGSYTGSGSSPYASSLAPAEEGSLLEETNLNTGWGAETQRLTETPTGSRLNVLA